MVAENGDDRDVDRRVDLPGQGLRLLGKAAVGQIAGEDEEVAGPARLREEIPEGDLRLRRLRVMEVRHRPDPYRPSGVPLVPLAPAVQCHAPAPSLSVPGSKRGK